MSNSRTKGFKLILCALKNKKIAAVLDVFKNEPSINSKFVELDNVLLSPYCGASTINAINRMGIMVIEGLISILEEKNLNI